MKLHNYENQDKITIDEMIDLFVENRTSTIVLNLLLYITMEIKRIIYKAY